MERKRNIKREDELFKYDMSKEDWSYTKALVDANAELTELGNDFSVGRNEYVARVLEIVSKAKDTPAKRNFVSILSSKKGKVEAMTYVTNAFMKGLGLEVI